MNFFKKIFLGIFLITLLGIFLSCISLKPVLASVCGGNCLKDVRDKNLGYCIRYVCVPKGYNNECTVYYNSCQRLRSYAGGVIRSCCTEQTYSASCSSPDCGVSITWGEQNYCGACTLRSVPIPSPSLACPKITSLACMTGNKIHVIFKPVSGAYSYRIYRDDKYQGQATTNTFNDTGVSCGVKHTYDVKPFQSGGSERNCQQNYPVTCACPKIPTPPPPNRR